MIINNPTKVEKDALSGIMKKDYSKNNTISINLNKFQERLDNTKFAGATLKEIIENYFMEDVISNKESKQKYNDEIKQNIIAGQEAQEVASQFEKDIRLFKRLKNIIFEINSVYLELFKDRSLGRRIIQFQ